MGSSFTNVDIHLIFHTKSNGCVMKEEDLPRIFHYIGGIIRSMSGFAFIVGGRPDHIHILTAVPVSMSLADLVRDVKSCTTKWIKGIDASYDSFSWQEGYGAFSVSISSRNDVINYIQNQKSHHQTQTTHEEFSKFLKKHNIHVDEKYRWWNNTSSL